MNALTTQNGGGALAAYGAGKNAFDDAASDLGAGGGAFLKFNGNTGDFTFGAEGDEIPHGTQLAVQMDGFARGFICWVEGDVVEEVMVKVVDGKPPLQSDLADHGPYEKHDDGTQDGWSEQARVTFISLEDGETYVYKTSSKSGLRALGNLLRDFARQMRSHPDALPVAEFGATSFIPKNNKKIGKKYAPSFKLVGWVQQEEIDALADGAGGEDDAGNYADEPADATPAKVEETAAEVAAETAKALVSALDSMAGKKTIAPQTAAPTGRRARF